jgi:hypothetical protein
VPDFVTQGVFFKKKASTATLLTQQVSYLKRFDGRQLVGEKLPFTGEILQFVVFFL